MCVCHGVGLFVCYLLTLTQIGVSLSEVQCPHLKNEAGDTYCKA